MANLGGGAEAHAPFKQYNYLANSSRTYNRLRTPDTHVSTGEPKSLCGKIDTVFQDDEADRLTTLLTEMMRHYMITLELLLDLRGQRGRSDFDQVVLEVSTSKTGKHGHAKCHFVANDIFNSKKLEDIVPSSHNRDNAGQLLRALSEIVLKR